METSLKKDIYEELKLVWTGSATREFSVDCVIPDIMPDAGSVVDAEGVILLRSKETEPGGLLLTAAVNASILYAPEDGGALRSLTASVPVELRFDAPMVDIECRTICQLRIRALDARMVNSRKVTVRADVEAIAQSYQRNELAIASELEGDNTEHLLTESAVCVLNADVREKTFVITDDYALPVGISGVDGILSQRLEVSAEDAKFVSGKVVFRGRIKVHLLLSGTEPEQVVPVRYETEFSQIMEVDGEGDIAPEVNLCFTGIYFDLPERNEQAGRIMAELHMAAQCICRKRTEMTYIADLYSNRMALVPEIDTVHVIDSSRPLSMRQTVSGRAEPIVGEGEVVSLAASVGSISVEVDTVKTAVNIRLLCRHPDGRYTLSRCRLGAEFTMEQTAGTELQGVTVSVVDVYHTAANNGADVRATLQMEALAIHSQSIHCVTDVRVDEEAWNKEKAIPSMTLVRVTRGDDIWALAKKYRSSVEAITLVNEGKEDGLFLIPKSR